MTATAMLTGAQKAALILVQLGKERAAPVLRSMSEGEVEDLMAEVARMGSVRDEVMHSVLIEFVQAATAHLKGERGGVELDEHAVHDLVADRPHEIGRAHV